MTLIVFSRALHHKCLFPRIQGFVREAQIARVTPASDQIRGLRGGVAIFALKN